MNERILVIEDDEYFRTALIDLLKEEEYRVTGAGDGPSAIEAVKKNFFELILADVKLPGGFDGIETVKRIKQIHPQSKSMVIIITGFADVDAPVRAIKVGVDDYIYKPFDIEVFLHSVKRNIDTYRLEQLKQEHTKIIEKLNQELEQRVRERTQALEKSNQELKATQAKLIQSAKMSAIGHLGAGVAHELNNPLGGILGYLQFMQQKLKKPGFSAKEFMACKKYLSYIEKESERCKSIVENLLNFSRKSRQPFVPEDINKIIQNVFSLIGHQLALEKVKVDLNLDPDLKKVLGHHNQLQQVFTDIILNAQQAMPKGGKLKIATKNIKGQKSRTPQKIRIEFTDTGCGIAKKNRVKIFDPFFTTRAKFKGTGLGLSVSYQIIREHKGEISVKSKLGTGTTFVITLPIHSA
ncbi:MAG: response regulator [Candidatus Omnitrophica bacterium]|nr:response regulator [Candidatus Omnitrophota bacterium]